jgi:arginyl-tRNA--protein-N-Asp/Glu arginylyltransferase
VQGGERFRQTEEIVSRSVYVNGMPGSVAYLGGRPLYVVTIDVVKDGIGAIYFITNPDKLSHIPPLRAE